MLIIEKLSLMNIKHLKKLQKQSENIYNKDFFEDYNAQSFIIQYLKRKEVKLFKYKDEYIGYIWIESPIDTTAKILALYINDVYINIVKEEIIKIFRNKSLVFDVMDNHLNYEIMKKLGFKELKITSLMKIKISNQHKSYLGNKFNFKNFTKKEDEKLRCFIQNSVFHENDRIPLVPYDIKLEEQEDYYIDNLCVFVMEENKAVGYGQVILRNGLYTIVNVGILEEYRGNGYGEMLIRYLLYLCYNENINVVAINVDSNNYNAISLYKKVGFDEYGKITTWGK